MPFKEGFEIIIEGEKQLQKKEIWQMWLARYQWMTQDTFIPFQQFYERCIGANIDLRPAEEIIEESLEIERGFELGNKSV